MEQPTNVDGIPEEAKNRFLKLEMDVQLGKPHNKQEYKAWKRLLGTSGKFDDSNAVRKLVSTDGHLLRFASDRVKADYTVVSYAVSRNESALRYASIELRSSRGFMKYMADFNPDCRNLLDYATAELKCDRDLIIDMLSLGQCVEIPDELLDDDVVTMLALDREFIDFKDMSTRLKQDRQYVKRLLSGGYITLKEFAVDSDYKHYCSDAELVMIAVRTRSVCELEYADVLLLDKSFVLTCIPYAPAAFKWGPVEVQNDLEVQLSATVHGYDSLVCESINHNMNKMFPIINKLRYRKDRLWRYVRLLVHVRWLIFYWKELCTKSLYESTFDDNGNPSMIGPEANSAREEFKRMSKRLRTN